MASSNSEQDIVSYYTFFWDQFSTPLGDPKKRHSGSAFRYARPLYIDLIKKLPHMRGNNDCVAFITLLPLGCSGDYYLISKRGGSGLEPEERKG